MKLKYNVTGMTCAACSARVEKVTAAVEGVEKAEVNLLGGTMVVEARSDAVHEAIIRAVVNAGYGASLADGKKKEVKKEWFSDLALWEMFQKRFNILHSTSR